MNGIKKTIRVFKIVVLAIVLFSVAIALAVSYKFNAANRLNDDLSVQSFGAISASDSVMILAPHCDDEALACSGIIQDAINKRAKIKIIIATNGDGFPLAMAASNKSLAFNRKQYIKFAYKRQKETLQAMSKLGVDGGDIIFLGYPDRGLARMWDRHWTEDNPYRSKYIDSTFSPYVNSFTSRAIYCGERLLADIEELIEKCKPNIIFTSHPMDNHPDHYALYCFTCAALENLRRERKIDLSKLQTYVYLIHRGDWPAPRGYNPKLKLLPPYNLSGEGDTNWFVYKLTDEQIRKKKYAIESYKTQTTVEKGYLLSFVRSNELFGKIAEKTIAKVNSRKILVDGNPEDWHSIKPVLNDSTSDYLARVMYPAGDVRTVYMARDDDRIYIRVDLVRKASKRIKYAIYLKSLLVEEDNGALALNISLNDGNSYGNSKWAVKNNILEASINASQFDLLEPFYIRVKTKIMKLTVDDTGWREVNGMTSRQ